MLNRTRTTGFAALVLLCSCGQGGQKADSPTQAAAPSSAERVAPSALPDAAPSPVPAVQPAASAGSALCGAFTTIIGAREQNFASLPAGFTLKPDVPCAAVEREFEVGPDGETVSLPSYECVYLDVPDGSEAQGREVWDQVQADVASCFDGSWQIAGEVSLVEGRASRGLLLHRKPDAPRLPFEATDLDTVRFTWSQKAGQRIAFTVVGDVQRVDGD